MIVLYTGVPGSGKTYLAVKSIADLLKNPNNVVISNVEGFRFERFKLFRDYQIKKISDETFINVECGQYIDITKELVKRGSSFFDYTQMKKFLEPFKDKNVFIFIDECQRYFPKWFKDSEVIYFFDYHRHLGLDIYLISQSSYKICPDIVHLTEYELRAVPSSLKFKNMFVYKRLINNDILGRQVLKRDKRIFSLYKSFQVQNENIQMPKILFAIPVFFIFAVFALFYVLSKFAEMGGV